MNAELQPSNKQALFGADPVAGATHFVVAFDGYGDSGQIASIETKSGDGFVAMPEGEIEIARVEWDRIEPVRSTFSIADAIERLTYDHHSDTHRGWEERWNQPKVEIC